jgi:ParB family transcriptional regulator, chromosome partitioning protein
MEQASNGKKLVLGKGMAALFGDKISSSDFTEKLEQKNINLEKNDGGSLLLPLEKIEINPAQPRKVFKEKEIEELAQSIRENGIIQPLIVTSNPEQKNYLLIAGERRYRAAKHLGLEFVPVVIKKATKKEQMVMSIIENVQRSDLNCVEEALAYYQLMEEFKLTQEEVAKKIGKERSTIANYLRILKLPKEIVMMLQKDLLSFGHAKILASLRDDGEMLRAANLAVAKNLSVRDLENITKKSGAKNSSGPIGPEKNKRDDEKYFIYQQKLERKTGFQTKVKNSGANKGQIIISYNSADEFKNIFEYLMGLK